MGVARVTDGAGGPSADASEANKKTAPSAVRGERNIEIALRGV
jgi:hypothetical protein